MQHKHYNIDVEWLPKEGGGIRLWKEDKEREPILPTRESNAFAPQQMQNHFGIAKGIGGFINIKESLSVKDSIKEYWRSHERLIQYRKGVKLVMV